MILHLACSLQYHLAPLPKTILILLPLLSENLAFEMSPRASDVQLQLDFAYFEF
ncbi:rCG57668, isoform CRA_f [Rattus norvegicus]|uniref:RCG57668, isoform CRA_f n=1 Tax=Rattus norvegicus TaxID=10116 RepID=A6JI01_RAT|nr:rCG57668, isoform CRA_f [Rattus norvegicus]